MEQMIPGFLEEMLKKTVWRGSFREDPRGISGKTPGDTPGQSPKGGPELGGAGTYRCRDRV